MGAGGFARRALRETASRRGQLVPLVVALLLGLVFSLGEPFIWKLNIEQAIATRSEMAGDVGTSTPYRQAADALSIPAGPGDPGFVVILALTIVGFVLLAIIQWLGNLAATARATRLGASIADDLRLRLFAHLQGLSIDFFRRSRTGDLVSRVTADIDAVENGLARSLPAAASHALLLVFAVVLIALLDWRFAVTLVIVGVLLYFIWRWMAPGSDQASYHRQRDAAVVASTVGENVSAQPLVKAFGLERMMLGRFRAQVEAMTRGARTTGFFGGVHGTFAIVAIILLFTGVMLTAIPLFVTGNLQPGTGPIYITIGLLIRPIVAAMHGLTQVVEPLQRAGAAMERVDELLAEQPRVIDRPDSRPLPPPSQHIRLEDVAFAYEPDRPVLRGVSLEIPVGSFVAIVGQSGSGKTTLVNLLARLYDPTAGTIAIDGHDLRSVTQASLRAQMGIIFQETFLVDGTLGENLRIGRPEATHQEVEAAAREAEIHEFIASLPEGYDTQVGEGGVLLSAGQRERIAIARALLRRPALLLLDEPTAALDPSTEAAVMASLRRQREGRTVLLVSHRLATVVDADRIIVLQDGRIVEAGTHEELLARQGAYEALWQRQSGLATSDDGTHARVAAARLRSIPVFEQLDDALLTRAARRFVTETVAEGRVVIHEGDAGDRFYLVVRGALEVVQGGERLRVVRDGDHFGEIALLRNVPRTASVCALVPSVLLSLQRGQFEDLIEEAPALRERLLHAYGNATATVPS